MTYGCKEISKEGWFRVLDVYRDNPYLWDKTHKLHSNREIRDKAFKKIFDVYKEYYPKSDANINLLKKKIDNMRTSYTREMKKVKAAKAVNEEYIPTLWYYNKMTFLEGHVTEMVPAATNHKSLQNYNEECEVVYEESDDHDYDAEDSTYSQHNVESMESEDSNDQKMKRIKREKNVLSKKLKTHSPQNIVPTSHKVDDECATIGKSIGYQLRRITDETQQAIAMKLVSDAIYYAKVGRLSEDSFICTHHDQLVENPLTD